MTTVTASFLISSCLKCEQVTSLVDQLTKSMHEFEIFTMEMTFDPKSAKEKSRKVLANFWQLISMIKSIKVVENKEDLSEIQKQNQSQSQASSSSVASVKVEKQKVKTEPQDSETENDSDSDSENEPKKSNRLEKGTRKTTLQNPIGKRYSTGRRLEAAKKANKCLRTIKCETRDGFYDLFECIKCERQFNSLGNARRHVKHMHLQMGIPCPTCKNPYFDEKVLEFHIPRCSKGEGRQLKQIKIRLEENRKKPVIVHLKPYENPSQNRKHNRNRTKMLKNRAPARARRLLKKYQNPQQSQLKGRTRTRKEFDPSKVKVNNPFPNFSLEKTLNVKVVMERLKMEKSGKISSISQPLTSEKIKTETDPGKSVEVENESKNMNQV